MPSNFKVAHSSGVAKIMFIPAKRALRGKYVLRAKNQFGEDAAEVEINVWGKPTAPRGAIQLISPILSEPYTEIG